MRRFPSSSSSSSDETENASSLDSSNLVPRTRRRRELKRQINSRERQRDPNHKDAPRSADNSSFSFKHFLQQNDSHSYGGARPKVYPATHRSSSDLNLGSDANVYPRNPTKLPDFVQDHLVIEQCYMNQDEAAVPVPDMDNLPDFALNSVEKRSAIKNDPEGPQDLSLDLTDYLNRRHRDQPSPNVSDSSEIDFQRFERNDQRVNSLEALGFPFDLQVPAAESNSAPSGANADDCPANSIPPNVTKSLPDFLNDGPIRNRGQMPTDRSGSNSAESPEMRLRTENEMLRRELEISRRLAAERLSRIQTLESELSSRRLSNHDESLEKTIEQVEDNLKRSTKRAINAESTIAILQKDIDSLTDEISMLRLENTELRLALGFEDGECSRASTDKKIACVATDLKAAATSAEVSLRQLMSGVSNLRMLASTLENMNRIEDRTKEYLPDFEEDNAAGPAL